MYSTISESHLLCPITGAIKVNICRRDRKRNEGKLVQQSVRGVPRMTKTTNKGWFKDRENFKLSIEMELKDSSITLSESQYISMLNLFDAMTTYNHSINVEDIRSLFSMKSPRGRWMFAMTAILRWRRSLRKAFTPAYVQRRRETRLRYMDLYATAALQNRSSKEARRTIAILENNLSFGDIL